MSVSVSQSVGKSQSIQCSDHDNYDAEVVREKHWDIRAVETSAPHVVCVVEHSLETAVGGFVYQAFDLRRHIGPPALFDDALRQDGTLVNIPCSRKQRHLRTTAKYSIFLFWRELLCARQAPHITQEGGQHLQIATVCGAENFCGSRMRAECPARDTTTLR
jgi:hypothetical protein